MSAEHRAWRLIGGILIAAALVTSASSAATSPALAGAMPAARTAFADGQWTGRGRLTGSISKGNFVGSINGSIAFAMTVTNARVTGRMSYAASVDLQAGSVNVVGAAQGLFTLSGPAAAPRANGDITTITASNKGVSGGASVPARTTLSMLRGTCNRMTGDTAVVTRNLQQGAGYSTTVTGTFVANRARTARGRCR